MWYVVRLSVVVIWYIKLIVVIKWYFSVLPLEVEIDVYLVQLRQVGNWLRSFNSEKDTQMSADTDN